MEQWKIFSLDKKGIELCDAYEFITRELTEHALAEEVDARMAVA